MNLGVSTIATSIINVWTNMTVDIFFITTVHDMCTFFYISERKLRNKKKHCIKINKIIL